jgi:hypothetical protein
LCLPCQHAHHFDKIVTGAFLHPPGWPLSLPCKAQAKARLCMSPRRDNIPPQVLLLLRSIASSPRVSCALALLHEDLHTVQHLAALQRLASCCIRLQPVGGLERRMAGREVQGAVDFRCGLDDDDMEGRGGCSFRQPHTRRDGRPAAWCLPADAQALQGSVAGSRPRLLSPGPWRMAPAGGRYQRRTGRVRVERQLYRRDPGSGLLELFAPPQDACNISAQALVVQGLTGGAEGGQSGPCCARAAVPGSSAGLLLVCRVAGLLGCCTSGKVPWSSCI